jgi:hypothetical protein
MMTTSFWKEAANSLPAPVRDRYAAYFEAAERWEIVLDAAVDACRLGKHALAEACRGAARLFRATAGLLDAAARSFTPTP